MKLSIKTKRVEMYYRNDYETPAGTIEIIVRYIDEKELQRLTKMYTLQRRKGNQLVSEVKQEALIEALFKNGLHEVHGLKVKHITHILEPNQEPIFEGDYTLETDITEPKNFLLSIFDALISDFKIQILDWARESGEEAEKENKKIREIERENLESGSGTKGAPKGSHKKN